jgi:thermostable 8-oxoguanine DNA glycosylase
MMPIANQIEEIALDFGKRFSQNEPGPPISCPIRLKEMIVAAAIGSGVRYETAESMAKRLLKNPTSGEIELVASKHRFPNQTRSRLVSIFANGASLLESTVKWLDNPTCVLQNRKLMSNAVPGLGPKQSSFLLSCSGYGQNIAVLDRHILRYLQLIGLVNLDLQLTSWKKYENTEMQFLTYSHSKNVRPDALDLAIWITMKAAGRRISECVQ